MQPPLTAAVQALTAVRILAAKLLVLVVPLMVALAAAFMICKPLTVMPARLVVPEPLTLKLELDSVGGLVGWRATM